MSERFEKLFSLGVNLYKEGSPIIIEAGALLLDNIGNRVLAQLKIKNINEKRLLAVKVKIHPFDIAGRLLEQALEYNYLDINVRTGEAFGTQNPIYLPNSVTRSYRVSVTEVVFDGGEIWNGGVDFFEPLKEKHLLDLGDQELNKQLRIKFGQEFKYAFVKEKDLWFCPCGTINKGIRCYSCRTSLEDLESYSIEDLKKECAERLAEENADRERREAEERAEVERRAAELKEVKRKMKRLAIISTPIVCVIIAIIIVLSTVIIPNVKYNDAIALMNMGKYTEAKSAFKVLDGYKDSINKIEECNIKIYGEEAWNTIKNINVGDTYKFGSYEQDNNKSNGQEDIEWLVLSKEGTKILLISKYAIDCKPYNTSFENTTWETCTIRKWLNTAFINYAFSADEKAVILTVTVSADKNPEYSTNSGNATQDQVFLLSINEVYKYFGSDKARQCKPTNFAVANGVTERFSGDCEWWLRSPGSFQNYASIVNRDGNVFTFGDIGSLSIIAIRPALWIDLDNL